jgi:hypothetical protein
MNRKRQGFGKLDVGLMLTFALYIFLPQLGWAGDIDATVNNQPIATNDTATTNQNTSIDIDVLSNDSDPDGDPVTIVALTPATYGLIKFLGNTIRYLPAANFTGTDNFTYTVGDGKHGRASATVTITVNTAPTAQNDSGTTSSGTAVHQ